MQNDDAYFSVGNVLLVLNALVHGDEDVEISLNQLKKVAVAPARPTLSGYSRHSVFMKITNQSSR